MDTAIKFSYGTTHLYALVEKNGHGDLHFLELFHSAGSEDGAIDEYRTDVRDDPDGMEGVRLVRITPDAVEDITPVVSDVQTWYDVGESDGGFAVVRFDTDRPDPDDPLSYEPLYIAVDLTQSEASELVDDLSRLIPAQNR